MSTHFKRLAVYCGSATPSDPRYIQLARNVGEKLAARGIGVVYGGGKVGLMGAVSDAALAAGGEVIGVIPEALENHELSNRNCTQLHVVEGMHERKRMFTDLADGFINLPGGVGTMDELWEAVSWAQLGYHANPVGLLNAFGYYDKLLEFNRHMAETGFVREAHRGIILDADTLEGLLDKMEQFTPTRNVLQIRGEDL